jgi:hypothetical protein
MRGRVRIIIDDEHPDLIRSRHVQILLTLYSPVRRWTSNALF